MMIANEIQKEKENKQNLPSISIRLCNSVFNSSYRRFMSASFSLIKKKKEIIMKSN